MAESIENKKRSTVEERAILIEDLLKPTNEIPEEKIRDRLIIHFQKKSYGGGDVEKILYPLPSHVTKAIIIFSEALDLDDLSRQKHVVAVKKGTNMPVAVHRLPKMFEEFKVVINTFYLGLIARDKTDELIQKLRTHANAALEQSSNVTAINIQDPLLLEAVQDVVLEVACLNIDRNVEDAKADVVEWDKHTQKGTTGSTTRSEDDYSSKLITDKRAKHLGNALPQQFATEINTVNLGNEQLETRSHQGMGSRAATENDITSAGDEKNENNNQHVKRERKRCNQTPSLAPSFSNSHSPTYHHQAGAKDKIRRETFNDKPKKELTYKGQVNSVEHLGPATTDTGSASHEKQSSRTVSVNPLLFNYLEVKQKKNLSHICQKYGVKIECSSKEEDGQGQVKVVSDDSIARKSSCEDIQQAGEEFVDLYQSCYNHVVIRAIPLEGIVNSLDKVESLIWTEQPSVLMTHRAGVDVTLVGIEKEVQGALKRITALTSKPRKLKSITSTTSSSTSNSMDTAKTGFGEPFPSTDDGDWKPVPNKTRQKRFVTNEGLEVVVKKDDLTKQRVDVIVNASNTLLSHGKGVAGALLRAAGQELQDECDRKRRNISKTLSEGDCVHTLGYRLPCTYIVHAIGPIYSSNGAENLFFSKLKETFENVFKLANILDAKTIAVPLISSGLYGGPKELCARALVGAIREYSKTETRRTIQMINLVNIDDEANSAISTSVELFLKDDDRQMDIDSEREVKPKATQAFWKETFPNAGTSKGAFDQPTESSQGRAVQKNMNAIPTLEVNASGNVQIMVVQQELHENIQAAKVLIVPTDNMLCNNDGIARDVEKAAGTRVRRDCRDIMAKRSGFPLGLGEFTHTYGYNLNCENIVFVVFPDIKRYESKNYFSKELSKLVFECMKYTDETLRVKSVALPLFPSDVDLVELSSAAYASAFHQFTDAKPKNIKHIVVVTKGTEAHMALQVVFEEEFLVNTDANSNKKQNPHGARGESDQQFHTDMAVNCILPKRMDDEDEDEGSGSEEEKKCPICFDDFESTKPAISLGKCKHKFCQECLDKAMKHKPVCPICGVIYGAMRGNQPDGRMNVTETTYPSLPGYEGCGTITINYYFPDGMQGEDHPSPGQRYRGTSRTAYLPNNTEGKKVVHLLRKAFDARLIFTVGTSVTTGARNTVTWNDIHHKTNTHGGAQGFGYPDPTYLQRVTEELAAKGIK